MIKLEKRLMRLAIKMARAAAKSGDYPIGAVAHNTETGEIMVGMNEVKHTGDSTRHAEIELIRKICSITGRQYLPEWVLYSTHELCPMCSGAAVWAKLGGIVSAISIDDMKKKTDERNYYKWRIMNLSCKEVVKETDIVVYTKFLRDEALPLLDIKHR